MEKIGFFNKYYWLMMIFALVGLTACGESATPASNSGPTVVSQVPPSLPTPSANLKIGYAEAALVGKIDGVAITAEDFNKAVDEARATAEEQAGQPLDWKAADNKDLLKNIRQQSFDGIVNYQVVAAQASRENVTAPDDQVQLALDNFKKQMGTSDNYRAWLSRRFMTEEDYKKRLAQVVIFEQMSQRHSAVDDKAEQVHVRHILVKTELEARNLFGQLQQGADFAALARQFSIDLETAPKGGDLDWIFHGQTEPAFEQAAFSLAPNAFSGPVKTDKGVHLIMSLGKEVRPLPVDLVEQRRQEAFSSYIKNLRDKAKIEQLIQF